MNYYNKPYMIEPKHQYRELLEQVLSGLDGAFGPYYIPIYNSYKENTVFQKTDLIKDLPYFIISLNGVQRADLEIFPRKIFGFSNEDSSTLLSFLNSYLEDARIGLCFEKNGMEAPYDLAIFGLSPIKKERLMFAQNTNPVLEDAIIKHGFSRLPFILRIKKHIKNIGNTYFEISRDGKIKKRS